MVVRDDDLLIWRRSRSASEPGRPDLPAHRSVYVLIRANGSRATVANRGRRRHDHLGSYSDLHPADARISTQGMTTRTEEGASGSGCVIPWVEKMSRPATRASNTSDSDKTPEAALIGRRSCTRRPHWSVLICRYSPDLRLLRDGGKCPSTTGLQTNRPNSGSPAVPNRTHMSPSAQAVTLWRARQHALVRTRLSAI